MHKQYFANKEYNKVDFQAKILLNYFIWRLHSTINNTKLYALPKN